jgi:hypothetical protein
MVVTDGNGLPIGLTLASARPHEVKLAVATGDGPCAPAERTATPAPTGASRRHGLRQSGVSPVVEGQGDQADHPPQSTGAEAQETRPTDRGGAALCRAVEGGAALQLAGQLPASAGPSRSLPLHLSCFRSRSVHRHLPATILKGVLGTCWRRTPRLWLKEPKP